MTNFRFILVPKLPCDGWHLLKFGSWKCSFCNTEICEVGSVIMRMPYNGNNLYQ